MQLVLFEDYVMPLNDNDRNWVVRQINEAIQRERSNYPASPTASARGTKLKQALKDWSAPGIVLIFLGIAFTQWGNYREFRGRTDERLNGIDAKLTTVNSNIEQLTRSISELFFRQARDLSQEKKTEQASDALKSAAASITNGSNTGVVDQDFFKRVSTYLKDTNLPQSETHFALTKLAAYRTSLEALPSVPRDAPSTKEPVIVPPQPRGTVIRKVAPGAFFDFRSTGSSVIGLTLVGATDGVTQVLDNVVWKDVAFINVHIVYRGGTLDLRNVSFINCTFEFPENISGTRLAEAISLKAKGLDLS